MYRSKTSFLLLKGMYVFWMCEKSILVANASDLVVPCCYHLYCNIVCFHWYNWCKKKKERLFYMYYLLQATMSIYHVIETLDHLLTRIHFCLYRHKNSPSCCWSWCIWEYGYTASIDVIIMHIQKYK